MTTAIFYFATKVGDKASFHREMPEGGGVNTVLHKLKVTLDLKYGDKESIKKLMFVDIWTVVHVATQSLVFAWGDFSHSQNSSTNSMS